MQAPSLTKLKVLKHFIIQGDHLVRIFMLGGSLLPARTLGGSGLLPRRLVLILALTFGPQALLALHFPYGSRKDKISFVLNLKFFMGLPGFSVSSASK